MPKTSLTYLRGWQNFGKWPPFTFSGRDSPITLRGMDDFLSLPLHEPPQIYMASIGVHGQRRVERYLLPQLWCVHLCRYHGVWMVDDREYHIAPGSVIFIPPATPMEFRFTPGRHVHISIHFAAYFEGVEAEGVALVAAHQNLGEFETAYRSLEAVVDYHYTTPPRAQARFWDFLWSVATRSEPKRLSPLVSQAMELIERRLTDPLSVADLAGELGVSHNHLTRQMKAATGLTPVDFIRQRRVQQAQYLLHHSTLPIKAIASQVGLGDFHSFNKAMRRLLGCGPREWREKQANLLL